jgi:hypothetical protein
MGDNHVPQRIIRVLALAGGSILAAASQQANAHAVAGNRVFPVTLTMDDPGVSDEASVPTFQYQRDDSSGTPTDSYGWNFEYDKTVTQNFGLGVNWGYNLNSVHGGKTAGGFQNLFLTGKYQTYVNAPHEFIMSVGVVREFGGTGNTNQGADRFGSTEPTIYMGKGLGDLPIGTLRPFAITGELGYNFQDVKQNSTNDNQGGQNGVDAAISIQYSMPYLQSQVKDFGLPDFFNHLIPLVELTWSVPTGGVMTPSPTTFQIAPGVIYMADTWQFGVEALIPGNTAAGTHVGVIAMFHLFFDDLFPNSLGKPLVDW